MFHLIIYYFPDIFAFYPYCHKKILNYLKIWNSNILLSPLYFKTNLTKIFIPYTKYKIIQSIYVRDIKKNKY